MKYLISFHGTLDLIWLVFLLLILGYFRRDRQNLKKTKSWLITQGRITHFEWVRDGEHLWPSIEYAYTIQSVEFRSNYFFLDTTHNSPNSQYARKLAYRIAMAYERNEPVPVYYNPINPQQAVLDISMPKKLIVIITLVFILIITHLSIMLFHLIIK